MRLNTFMQGRLGLAGGCLMTSRSSGIVVFIDRQLITCLYLPILLMRPGVSFHAETETKGERIAGAPVNAFATSEQVVDVTVLDKFARERSTLSNLETCSLTRFGQWIETSHTFRTMPLPWPVMPRSRGGGRSKLQWRLHARGQDRSIPTGLLSVLGVLKVRWLLTVETH
ncbi:hypothetical protein HG15A2_29650 [Adhaeretor mobilis]|uniref:Uncharacterized protein n=1 Tax=Adhaeretor mobilis TaxID=1930276 RepID=A0A517MXM7_9BACT|nr:hypothetical protein HG15A2_29650 [Adhaeretor mobilis]